MNKHIGLVKKFLADDTSVTEEELRVNKEAACEAAYWAAGDFWAAAEAAYEAAFWAAYAAKTDNLENAECYKKLAIKAIEEYEELTK